MWLVRQEIGDTSTLRPCLPFTGGGERATKGSAVRSMRPWDALPAGDCAGGPRAARGLPPVPGRAGRGQPGRRGAAPGSPGCIAGGLGSCHRSQQTDSTAAWLPRSQLSWCERPRGCVWLICVARLGLAKPEHCRSSVVKTVLLGCTS